MTYRGVVHGKLIELEDQPPFSEGQEVKVSIEPAVDKPAPGSPAAVLRAMQAPPHPSPEDIEALEEAIEAGKLSVHHGGVFDPDGGAP